MLIPPKTWSDPTWQLTPVENSPPPYDLLDCYLHAHMLLVERGLKCTEVVTVEPDRIYYVAGDTARTAWLDVGCNDAYRHYLTVRTCAGWPVAQYV